MARYTINEIEYPSVTEILGLLDKSSALIPWAVNSVIAYIEENYNPEIPISETLKDAKYKYKEISQEALDIGSQVHEIIELYIKSKIAGKEAFDLTAHKEFRDEVQNGFLAFLDWEEKNNVKWIESELTVYDPLEFYAGTLDAIAEKEGLLYTIDFKSSKGFYDGYDLQIAAYTRAYNFMKTKNILNCGILRLDKITGFPEFKDYSENLNKNIESFNNLVDFFYNYKKRRLKNNPRCKRSIK